MLNAVLASIAAALWLGSYGLYFLRDLTRWLQRRPYERAMSEMERLEATRVYAAWVRNMPPPPVRPSREPVMVPLPVVPPVGGNPVPFPGRRLIGN